MKIYKNIIVGSGLSGYLVYSKLKKNSLIITGETKNKVDTKKIHPKIKLILGKKTNKIADLIHSKEERVSIFSTASIGGLSNYWGKQFFDYKDNDYWPKKLFKNFDIYNKSLKIIDKLYSSNKDKIIRKIPINNITINQLSVPILKSNLTRIDKLNINKISERVFFFKKIKKDLIEVRTESNIFYCKHLILCAGPIGNAMILLKSFKNISYLKFKDHNPRVILGIIRNKKKYLQNKKAKLFDLEINKNDKKIGFSIIYNIDPNHFNKFLKPIITLFRDILKKFFFYGQLWIADEYNEIKLINNKDNIHSYGKTISLKKKKDNLIQILNMIGLKTLACFKLNYGFGYHYHCLRINFKGKIFSLNDFLKELKLNNNIFCFDSSIIEKIDIKPPTKTYLATTNYLVEKFLKRFN